MKRISSHQVSLVSAVGAILVGMISVLPACSAAGEGPVESEELVGAPEVTDTNEGAVSGTFPVGTVFKATTNVNLRKSASTGAAILHVVPEGSNVTLVEGTSSNGFYKVKHNGTVGWSYGKYYNPVSEPGGGGSQGSDARDKAIARAKAGKGFSYWWGHGRWKAEGPTASTKGSCSGSCPNCSHKGSYGADCSGYIGKIWQVPSTNKDLSVDQHPYSTANFVKDSSQWKTVSRSNVKPADALVYHSGGAGHIILYASGDGWGSMNAYECKGCAAGCVYNLRTASSSYKAIRRAGY